MTSSLRVFPVALVVGLALGIAPAPAVGAPLGPLLQQAWYELIAAEKASPKMANTKAWVKRKATATGRWIGRQKEKIKRIAD